jgi:hypothetical protein
MNKETTDERVCEVACVYCGVLIAHRCEEVKVEQGALLPLLTRVICFSFLYRPSFTGLIDNYDLVDSGKPNYFTVILLLAYNLIYKDITVGCHGPKHN